MCSAGCSQIGELEALCTCGKSAAWEASLRQRSLEEPSILRCKKLTCPCHHSHRLCGYTALFREILTRLFESLPLTTVEPDWERVDGSRAANDGMMMKLALDRIPCVTPLPSTQLARN